MIGRNQKMSRIREFAKLLVLTTAAGFGLASLEKSALAGDFTAGLVLVDGDAYFAAVTRGAKQAIGSDKLFVENYNGDAAKEAQAVDNMVARGVNAIITSALDPSGSVGAIARASKAKIPIICYNTCLNEADKKKYVKGFIYADQAGLGKMTGEYAAKYIKEKLGGKANIALVTCDSFPICRERKKAFLAALDKDGIQYKIVADQEAYLVDKSVPAAENMLTANPDVQVLWGANDGATIGSVKAVSNNGKAGKVVVFGTDMTPEIGNFLVTPDPILLATSAQEDYATGQKAVELARKAAAGQPIDEPVIVTPDLFYSHEDLAPVKAYLKSLD
jgi:ABC-type sugar transport system substrate-binding protein